MREVVLSMRIPNSWKAEVACEYEGMIKVVECMPSKDKGGKGLIKIDTGAQDMDAIIDAIKGHSNVAEVRESQSAEGGSMVSVWCRKKCYACQALVDSNCFLVESMTGKDGTILWTLLVEKNDYLSAFIENLRLKGCEVELVRTTLLKHSSLLTDRQEKIIEVAFAKGYYDLPKRTSIKKLAKTFDVSPSTLAEILQRGERKIIRHFFNN